jgi:TetR/AcrR family transcriptional regulator, transcriptional repressor of bet genes
MEPYVRDGDRSPRPGGAVLDAAVAVIAEQGLAGTSIRGVAARAGVSIGAVQHHFPSKDALLAAAMGWIEERHRERLARAHAGGSALQRLRAVVRTLVPGGAAARAEAAVWLAFVAHAAVHEPTARRHREMWARAEADIAQLLAEAGGVPPRSARPGAAALLGLADGLAVAVLLEPQRMPVRRARRLLDAALTAQLAALAR